MSCAQQGDRGYLCVDEFMRDAVSARALKSAFELGLVDLLSDRATLTQAELGACAKTDQRGMLLLTGLLRASGVIEEAGTGFRLAEPFRTALRYRDLIEAKLDFAAAVAPDFLDLFTVLLTDPAGFFERARLFDLFSYDRCFESTPENLAATAGWMRYTTVLTRYESAACIATHDFSRHGRMLDVGGNSGEFALRICRSQPALRATIFDLPVVCEIGERHVGSQPEAGRIDFAKVVRGGGPYPDGYDLVTFKSMLHDWPDEPMQQFLSRAYDALLPGGTLLIFERSLVEIFERPVAYVQIPLLLFFRAYRVAGDYRQPLANAGFTGIEIKSVALDMPFMLITAKKPAAP